MMIYYNLFDAMLFESAAIALMHVKCGWGQNGSDKTANVLLGG